MDAREFVTYREITSQGETLRQILSRLNEPPFEPQRYSQLLWTGCGSSFFLSQIAAFAWQRCFGVSCRAVPASELLLYPESYLNRTSPSAVFALTRTGETSETIRAAALVRDRYGAPVCAVTCYPDSEIARLEELQSVFPEAREESVVTTRAFTGILGAFLSWGGLGGELSAMPQWVEQSLRLQERRLRSLALRSYSNVIFLGTGPFYPLACEAMLKLKEMTGMLTEAWQTLEFRHGPKAVLNERTLVWLFAGRHDAPFLAEVVKDIRQLKAELCLVANQPPEGLLEAADYAFTVDWPLRHAESEALGLIHLAHLYAYFRSVNTGNNPDQPANLSRVVRW